MDKWNKLQPTLVILMQCWISIVVWGDSVWGDLTSAAFLFLLRSNIVGKKVVLNFTQKLKPPKQKSESQSNLHLEVVMVD